MTSLFDRLQEALSPNYRLENEWDAADISQIVGDRLLAQAEVEIAEGQYDVAVATPRRHHGAVGCNACGVYQLAHAYDMSGRSDSALAVYERAVTVPDALRIAHSSRYLGLTFQRLGELYKERNNRDNALHYYSELVDLWAGADEVLQPIVRDVRGRIARLAGEGR